MKQEILPMLMFILFVLSNSAMILARELATNETKLNSITQNFAQVIDASTAAYITTPRWTNALHNYGIQLIVPTCINPSAFPSTFDYSKDKITMCVEEETNHPWELVHELAAQLLIEQINSKYKKSLVYEIIKLNTTVKGYFPTMKDSVDNGPCQVAISSTNYDLNRANQVRFQCMYGQSSYGYLRTGLDNSTVSIGVESDLNKTGVILATYGNTIYDIYATKYFSAATLLRVNSGWYEVFRMAQNNQVHAILGEATDIRNWFLANTENCKNCSFKIFGQPFSYSSFITNNIISEAGRYQFLSGPIMFFIVIWSLMIFV